MNAKPLLVIENGKITRYESARAAAKGLGINMNTLYNRLSGKVDDGRTYIHVTDTEIKGNELKILGENTKSKVPYETLGTRVCITPCPHKRNVKIGSVLCQSCPSFRGISRSEHVVLCLYRDSSHTHEE